MKRFNGQRMTVFPQALKCKISSFRGKIYYPSVGDLIEWKYILQCQLGCVAGENKSSSMHSHSGRLDRQQTDRLRYTWNAEVQIRKEFLRNSVLWKPHNFTLTKRMICDPSMIRMLFQSNKWLQIFNKDLPCLEQLNSHLVWIELILEKCF